MVTEQRSKKPNRGGHIGVNCTALIKTEAIDSPKSQSWKKKRCHYFWNNWEIITMFVFFENVANVYTSPLWFISFWWLKGKWKYLGLESLIICKVVKALDLSWLRKFKQKVTKTIHILRQHNFGLFLTRPLKVINQHKYITEHQQNWQFSRPTQQSVLCFGWRNVWMVTKNMFVQTCWPLGKTKSYWP